MTRDEARRLRFPMTTKSKAKERTWEDHLHQGKVPVAPRSNSGDSEMTEKDRLEEQFWEILDEHHPATATNALMETLADVLATPILA